MGDISFYTETAREAYYRMLAEEAMLEQELESHREHMRWFLRLHSTNQEQRAEGVVRLRKALEIACGAGKFADPKAAAKRILDVLERQETRGNHDISIEHPEES